jgi:hypothetical protein
LRSFGAVNQVIKTTRKVIRDPNTTEGLVPISFAARPDSKAPISLDEPIKIELTDATLPRISCGVESCKIVCRVTILTLSHMPVSTSSAQERKKEWEIANPSMVSP